MQPLSSVDSAKKHGWLNSKPKSSSSPTKTIVSPPPWCPRAKKYLVSMHFLEGQANRAACHRSIPSLLASPSHLHPQAKASRHKHQMVLQLVSSTAAAMDIRSCTSARRLFLFVLLTIFYSIPPTHVHPLYTSANLLPSSRPIFGFWATPLRIRVLVLLVFFLHIRVTFTRSTRNQKHEIRVQL